MSRNKNTKRRRQQTTPKLSLRRSRSYRPDYKIVAIMAALVLISIVITYSISPALSNQAGVSENTLLFRHILNVAIGLSGFYVASRIPIPLWKKLIPLMVVITAATFIALPVVGIDVKGATRWIYLAGFTFQPVELAKLTIVLYMANLLSGRIKSKKINQISYTLAPALVLLFAVGFFVVVLQRDLGSMIVIVGVIMTMLFTAGMRYFDLALAGTAIAGAAAASVAMFPHRIARVAAFLRPEEQTEGSLYHVQQALIAVGSGGITGKGLGQSVQAYGYLPQAADDSIFAIYAEKVGFIGSVALIALYGSLLIRLLNISNAHSGSFEKLFVSGIFAWIFTHVTINIGAMLSIIPLTGITLPFISFGGTSIVFIMIALGIVFQISSTNRTTT